MHIRNRSCAFAAHLHVATAWYEILAGVILLLFFDFFSQDWRIIIWQTDLDQAPRAQVYTSLVEFFNLAILSYICHPPN